MIRFIFIHSHAFAGGSVVVQNAAGSGGGIAGVEFGDGIALDAECRREGDSFILEIRAYRTGKGTTVGAHHWRIVRDGNGTWRSWRES